MTFLSPHFSVEEATFSETAARKGLDNMPAPDVLHNMYLCADRMEGVRAFLNNRVIMVSSWYRSEEVNKAVGGAPTSTHPTGFAVDFRAQGLTVPQTVKLLSDSPIQFDQLINEYGRWVHIGFGPRMRREVFAIG